MPQVGRDDKDWIFLGITAHDGNYKDGGQTLEAGFPWPATVGVWMRSYGTYTQGARAPTQTPCVHVTYTLRSHDTPWVHCHITHVGFI